jgi:hypothetical protein
MAGVWRGRPRPRTASIIRPQRVEQSRSRLRHTQIAHDMGQDQRVQHRVKGVEHPAESDRQQGAALSRVTLLQELDRSDGHVGSDCSRGAETVV